MPFSLLYEELHFQFTYSESYLNFCDVAYVIMVDYIFDVYFHSFIT